MNDHCNNKKSTSPVKDISLEEILHPTAFKHRVLNGGPGEHGVEQGKLRLVEKLDFSALISLANIGVCSQNLCDENIMRWEETISVFTRECNICL